MNLWIFNHYALPPTKVGGTRHFTLAKELIRRGHDVHIVASSFDHFAATDSHLSSKEKWKIESIDGVPFLWLKTPSYSGNTPRRFWNMVAFALQIFGSPGISQLPRPDAIMGSSPHLFAALAAERLAANLGVPFIFEVRDIWPQSLVDLSNISTNHPAIQIMAVIEKHLYRSADRIVSLLPGAAAHMVENGATPNKIMWIPNGADLSLVKEPHPPRQSDTFTVMYAGTHGLANGLDTILDAASILQREEGNENLRIKIMGQGPEKERLQRRAADEDLRLVEFQDPVPKDKVYDVLAEADACLMILKDSPVFRWGVSPNKLFDYMAVARPVIFGVNSPFNPVNEANAGITIPAENPAAVATAIKHLATMSSIERWEMGLRGRSYVLQNHDFTRLADRLEELVQQILNTSLVSTEQNTSA